MANLCEKLISACIAADCDNAPFTGMGSKAFIANKSEIASLTYSQTNPNLVTSVTMKVLEEGQGSDPDVMAVLYTITQLGKTPFTGTQTEMTEGNTSNKFTETFAFTCPDNSPTSAMLLDNIANGKFVVFAPNEYTGSDGAAGWQVYGAKKGMTASSMTRDPYSDDTDGQWAVTLVSENVPNSAIFIQHMSTDATPVDDTESYLESLADCGA